VFFAACRDEEKAAELLPGVQGASEQGALWHGAATWYFLRTLDKPSPALTWARIHEEVSAAVRTRYARQTPQLMGPGETLLFGGAGEAQPPALTVLQVTGEGAAQKVQVDGGAALGINLGTRLAIFPANSTSPRPSPEGVGEMRLAMARVESVEVGTAWAALEAASAPAVIPIPALARVIAYGYGAARLKVAVESSEIGPTLADSSPLFEVVPEAEAELVVRSANDGVWIEDAAGTTVDGGRMAPKERDAKGVAQALEHYAIFRNVQRLSNLALGPALEDALHLSAPVALKPSRSDRAAFGQATPLVRDSGSVWQVTEGQQIGVQVTNRYSARLLVTVLALNPDFSIMQVEPRFERQTTLAAGKSLLVQYKAPKAVWGGRLLLKVLATVEPVSFASLLLPALNAEPIRRDAPVRDAGALGWLLDALRRTGGTPTRPAFTDPDDQWIALDISFQIAPQVSSSRDENVE
jgi:hypothetical protein